MGIKDFFKIVIKNKNSEFFGKQISDLGRIIKLTDLRGQAICIDASLTIYQAALAMQRVDSLTTKDGRSTVHINTIFNKIIMFANAGVTQWWIFDNPEVSELKQIEIQKRTARRTRAREDGKDKEAFKLTAEIVHEVMDLLRFMGVNYIVAPKCIEAEQYGAFLTSGPPVDRFCQYMVTADADVFLFGGNVLKPDYEKSKTGKSKRRVYKAYDLRFILNNLDIEYDQLITVGLALGSDFAPKTPRIGPKTVIQKVKDDKIEITDAQARACAYFKTDVTELDAEMVRGEYSREKVIEMLVNLEFKKDRIEKRLNTYEKTFKEE